MGVEIAITFETLYDLLIREKQREELLLLEPTFFQDVIIYLREKMKIWEKISSDNDLFSEGERDKVEMELKNIRKILKDLYERREKKIIDLAINKSRIGHGLEARNLLDEEKRLFENVAQVLDRHRRGILLNLLKMELPKIEEHKVVLELSSAESASVENTPTVVRQTVTVRFLHAVPKFVAGDLCVYGPFDEEDVANLPKDAAAILISKKRAEEIKGI